MAAIGDRLTAFIVVALVLGPLRLAQASGAPESGIQTRVAAAPWLHMPQRADGDMPRLLSQTGAFIDTARLLPSAGLIPYDLVVAFWSDGAAKQRWIAVPRAKIKFSATGEWSFPPGTVFVKTFDLPTDETHPDTQAPAGDAPVGARQRTAVFTARSTNGEPDGSDADLLSDSQTEDIPVRRSTAKSVSKLGTTPAARTA